MPPSATHSSGFSLLDEALGGGFPGHGVNRLQSAVGIGELRLLLPGLTIHDQTARLLVLINPPGQPYPDFWQKAGMNLDNILSLHPVLPQHGLWSAEQCLKSGCCHTVLLWQTVISVSEVKRLQLAANQGQCCLWLLQPCSLTSPSLPVNLSLVVEPHPQGIDVFITKRKGGWPAGPLHLDWRDRWPGLVVKPASSNVQPLTQSQPQSA